MILKLCARCNRPLSQPSYPDDVDMTYDIIIRNRYGRARIAGATPTEFAVRLRDHMGYRSHAF